jgi:hypothetical protein
MDVANSQIGSHAMQTDRYTKGDTISGNSMAAKPLSAAMGMASITQGGLCSVLIMMETLTQLKIVIISMVFLWATNYMAKMSSQKIKGLLPTLPKRIQFQSMTPNPTKVQLSLPKNTIN